MHSVCSRIGKQLNCAHGVVVAGDHVVDVVGRIISINDGDDWDSQLASLSDRDFLVPGIDHELRIRQTLHLFDSTETLFEFFQLATQRQRLFLA